MPSPHDRVIAILNEVKEILASPNTDVIWAGYDSVEEVVQMLDELIARLRDRDLSRRKDLELLFAPTGTFQEISISNGWADRFLRLADEFDQAMEEM